MAKKQTTPKPHFRTKSRGPRFSTSWRSPLRIANFTLLFAIAGTWVLLFASAATTLTGYYGVVESHQVGLVNQTRAANGRGALQHIECLHQVAQTHSKRMAESATLYHNPNLVTDVVNACQGGNWSIMGENVGYVGHTTSEAASQAVFNAYMASPAHASNILDSRFAKVGVGAYAKAGGLLWTTQVFATCSSSCPAQWSTPAVVKGDPVAPPPPPTDYTHYLRNSNTGGSPDAGNFKYGISTYAPLYCDWDGNGTDTPAMYDNGTWYIRNSNTAGLPDLTISYGAAGYIPVCGDWDGNGTDTIGVVIPGPNNSMVWHLRNSNSGGTANTIVSYGVFNTYKPVVGDWDGNGTDTIGVVIPGANNSMAWLLRNSNTPGSAEINVSYGVFNTYKPVVGDWDGNGTDTIGVYEGNGNWHLRNSNSPGSPNISLQYGSTTYIPVAGDWNGDKTTTVGVIAK